MLELIDVHSYYGESYILQGISLKVEEGSVVALLGRNGMGKTTTIRSIIGFNPPRRGVIRFNNEEINGLSPYKIAQKGIGLIPQGRHIFPSLSVKENLTMAARSKTNKKNKWTLENVLLLFPNLGNRLNIKGTLLSGGEQQMLAIARALMTNPTLLLMDEPSEGLAPKVIKEIAKIISELKKDGLSILIVEQNIDLALAEADNVYIISKGQIEVECSANDFRHDVNLKEKHLGCSG